MNSVSMPHVWLNGHVLPADSAFLSTNDRGFLLADGVFETVRVQGSRPLWLDDHLARLRRGAAAFSISVPFTDDVLRAAVDNLLRCEAHEAAALRITLTRGSTALRGLWNRAEVTSATLLMTVAGRLPLPAQRLVVARSTRRNDFSPLSRMKSLNYGDNLLARKEALERGATDALLMNSRDNFACACVGNVFFRVDGIWSTPPEAEGVLPGLARQRLLRLLPAIERPMPACDLERVEAALVSNSLDCAVVTHLDGRALAFADKPEACTALYADEPFEGQR
ncbi:branched-subunit amino acid aminotransferase/4-amino-4-deoxychorismate lyase [Paraburkholderia terricola]|uniref:aminotransferase class IV n=1 Tax=Paraburkholderia terricola TaxID=169427 RepID=UPI002863B841|nr:aminotransferase class IV [Paraburkholderia terricola]MDR6450030.1 branched-subunit amino acid aminotransferase/4-amino-4-deoxychorismate lyase [Paraburkholderia terricola]